MSPTLNKRKRGTFGEDLAVDFLRKKGYRILERNYHFEHGEIDIIAEEHTMLVFVEVKARRSKLYGEPEDAVTPKKQNQVRHTADGYLMEKNIDDRACRFDVVAIDLDTKPNAIRHIEDAF